MTEREYEGYLRADTYLRRKSRVNALAKVIEMLKNPQVFCVLRVMGTNDELQISSLERAVIDALQDAVVAASKEAKQDLEDL